MRSPRAARCWPTAPCWSRTRAWPGTPPPPWPRVTERATLPALPPAFAGWFAQRGWAPHRHQLEMLAAAQAGRSALLIAPTGGGKTLAGFLPSLIELAERPADG